MNNMGFFNPFGSSGSGGGGGGGSTANYSVKTFTDSSGQVSYKLTKNGTAVGDVISFNGSNMLVSYGGELVVLNNAIAGIEEALDKTYNFTTFTELEIDTHNKTLSQLSAELAAKNLEEGTVVTGRVYSEALPYNNYGNAEVLVNNSILWWKTSSSTISPYSWNAIVVGNTIKMDWTPTYYQLPIASAQNLGGVKIGDNVQIAPDGTISVITTKGDTGTGIASIAKTSSSGLNDIYTITYTDSTTSTFTVTNGATITGGSIGQTGHLILTMSDGRTIDAGALPTDNEVEVTTTSSQPADPNVELWVDLSTQQTLSIPEINDSSTSSTQDTWSCKKIYDEQQRQEEEIGVVANAGVKNLLNPALTDTSVYGVIATLNDGVITLNGKSTNSGGSTFRLALYPAGSVWLSGCILSGIPVNSEGVYMNLEKSGSPYTQYAHDTGNGAEIGNLPNDEAFIIFIRAPYNVQLTNFVIKPMIRPASITDSTFVPYAKTNRELTVAENEDRAALIYQVDSGAKNLSAVNSVSNQQNYIDIDVNLKAGKYIISAGSISTTSSDTSIRIGVYKKPNNLLYTYIDVGSNKYSEFEISDNADTVRVFASNSASISSGESLTFSDFMICTAADYAVSPAFVPYAKTNRELTVAEDEDRAALIEQVDEGSKNLLRFDETSTDNNNVRFTVNADGSITATQIAARTATAVFRMRYTDNLLSQDVRGKILSGCPFGGSDSTYKINIERRTSPYTNYGRDTGNGLLIPDTIADDIPLYLYIQVYSSATLPITFKPMICTKAAWDVSQKFVPYALSNAELTAKEQANENNILSAYGGIVGKNVAKENDFTATLNKTVYCNPITGTIHISAANVSSTDTDSTICSILLYYTDGTVSSNNLNLSRGSNISLNVNIREKIIERIVIYASDNYNNSRGDTVTVSDFMICTRADYAADPTYQPYAMSNVELTAAIQALQAQLNQ